MDFSQMFIEAKVIDEKALKAEIKKLTNKDGGFLKLRKLAKKEKDKAIDFIDYIHNNYAEKIESMAKSSNTNYDKIANLFMAV